MGEESQRSPTGGSGWKADTRMQGMFHPWRIARVVRHSPHLAGQVTAGRSPERDHPPPPIGKTSAASFAEVTVGHVPSRSLQAGASFCARAPAVLRRESATSASWKLLR